MKEALSARTSLEMGASLVRPTSAPPDLELSSKNVFAFSPSTQTRADYSRIFSLWGKDAQPQGSDHAFSDSVIPMASGGASVLPQIARPPRWKGPGVQCVSPPPAHIYRPAAPAYLPQHDVDYHDNENADLVAMLEDTRISSNYDTTDLCGRQFQQQENDHAFYYANRVPVPTTAPGWSTSPSSGSGRPASICKFFAQGRCIRGSGCNFAHITDTEGAGMFRAGSQMHQHQAESSVPTKSRPHRRSSSIKMSRMAHSLIGRDAAASAGYVMHLVNCLSSGERLLATDFQGKVVLLAKDQQGCRMLQRALDEDPFDVFEVVYLEAFPHMNQLMVDPFGNYLCQKIIQYCDASRRLALLSRVADDIVEISLNVHGTRVVQKLVEVMETGAEVSLVAHALRPSVVTLSNSLNGNHVIQRFLLQVPSPEKQFIYDLVSEHCVSIATHKHGCCVLQRCLDYATEEQRQQLMTVVVQHALELAVDQYGNYVVQYVLDLGYPHFSQAVLRHLLGNVPELATQKFSSNVIEKCLQRAEPETLRLLVDELCAMDELPRLLSDPFANFVIQKALTVADQAQFEAMVRCIRPHVSTLRSTVFGKRLYTKLVKKFPALEPGAD